MRRRRAQDSLHQLRHVPRAELGIVTKLSNECVEKYFIEGILLHLCFERFGNLVPYASLHETILLLALYKGDAQVHQQVKQLPFSLEGEESELHHHVGGVLDGFE